MGEWWPLHGLRVTTARLELRLPSYDDLLALAGLAAAGIHDPGEMPFGVPWTDAPPGERARGTMQWHWRALGGIQPEDWQLPFAVSAGGVVVGAQELKGSTFGRCREVHTGSWLGREHQGQGFGTEMRAAVLHFAFSTLGVRWATTSAFTDNRRSNAVSTKLGYQPDGVEIVERRGQSATLQRYRLSRDQWQHHATVNVHVDGVTPDVLALLGATS